MQDVRMADTDRRSHDETSDESTTNEDTRVLEPDACNDTVDPETREAVLTEYGHKCQLCGRVGPKKGGLAILHAHHIERNPEDVDEHDMENLTLICRACHSWHHQQSEPEDAPVDITEEDLTVLLPQDIEILQVLADDGPGRTGDIAGELTADLSVSAVRERLWVLMGLDNRVESRDRQIVDKDVETGEWGLTEQIETSARGHIPDDPQLLLQRMEDEQVRRALERGCDRSAVTGVLGITRRTTFNKAKRAYAYDFPLDVFGRGGRPSQDTQSEQDVSEEVATDESDDQQRLDAVAEGEDESLGRTETWGTPESESTVQSTDVNEQRTDPVASDGSGSNELREHLQQAIDALLEVDEAL
ncbi:HNH endonuclease [Natronorubrum tibetense GA33]|uniref:HNH endonuclease n=2 Tax=Natronorubrum tibetense TaxID=63128 RepID=L9VS53_9EURY|nr:HNH endonuclease [Natronorubrum tibetense GA33]